MNKEIKEILKCMKNYGSTTELALLDYITNLQQEIERLQQELQRKDNNWNELKRHIKEDDDCWDIDSILFMMEKLENGNK